MTERTEEEDAHAPLAHRMRSRTLEEFVGQSHLLGSGKLLERTIKADHLSSLIFYGPPGSGKTTLAYIISKTTRAYFERLNAVSSNVAQMRKVLGEAKQRRRSEDRRTILFVDEIHRFNKAQQDVLMPEVERGQVILIGATTHNPSFVINGPLLSRSLVFELRPLSEDDVVEILRRAASDTERGLGTLNIRFGDGALEHLAKQSSGDARRALIALEVGARTNFAHNPIILLRDITFARRTSQYFQQILLHFFRHDTVPASFIPRIAPAPPIA